MSGHDDASLEASRRAFEEKVRSAPRGRRPSPGGKGSPAALVTVGVIGTATLGAVALLLGGGLLLAPAAIPLLTVLLVLAARARAGRNSLDAAGGGRQP